MECNSPTTQQAYMTPTPLKRQGKELSIGLWFSMSPKIWRQTDIVFLSKGPVLFCYKHAKPEHKKNAVIVMRSMPKLVAGYAEVVLVAKGKQRCHYNAKFVN